VYEVEVGLGWTKGPKSRNHGDKSFIEGALSETTFGGNITRLTNKMLTISLNIGHF
jgi:hypothetical protein